MCYFNFLGVYGCNIWYGPSGEPECVKIDGYIGYQWATCLTDSYIKRKSSNRHQCRYSLANYCYYQCEIELNGKENGVVRNNCRCNPYATAPPTVAQLPQWCYVPSGDNCGWYRACLEKVHPCQNHEASYAISYGERFCKLYEESYKSFSILGQKWIDNVRRCLQLQLVPYVRNFGQQTSCDTIKDDAFKSHACCYSAGDSCSTQTGAPSVCDIPPKDWARIIFTIKGSLGDEFLNTMKSAVQVGSECSWDPLLKGKDRIIEFYFNAFGAAKDLAEARVTELGIAISKQLKETGLQKMYDWLYYPKYDIKSKRNVSILNVNKYEIFINFFRILFSYLSGKFHLLSVLYLYDET